MGIHGFRDTRGATCLISAAHGTGMKALAGAGRLGLAVAILGGALVALASTTGPILAEVMVDIGRRFALTSRCGQLAAE
jgi:hypothetical protein